MQSLATNHSLRDVQQYSSELLKLLHQGVQLSATYRKVWNDGFGARGWKLNATIGDPAIIASTRQAGERIATSVFVHDILDHFLSGFGVSGHRSEAMALMQLSYRTGSDPRPDFRQLVMEDVMHGMINGEALDSFLPEPMLNLLPSDKSMTGKQMIATLTDTLGHDALVEALVDHFVLLGKQGDNHAAASWQKLGLDHAQAGATGTALQRLLDKVDLEAESSGVDALDVSIVINDSVCSFIVEPGACEISETVYQQSVVS